uniref:Uncharacterized protein n=1 Tax=Tetranychus urticae TaxID=32264 RepID=T1KDR8_TETUR
MNLKLLFPSVFIFNFILQLLLVNTYPIVQRQALDEFIQSEHERSLASQATFLLTPMAVIIGTEGALLGLTGASFGDGIQFVGDEFASVGNGIKTVGDEIKSAGKDIQSISRALKGLSGVIFKWGTGGREIPVISDPADAFDLVQLLGKLPTNVSKSAFDFYKQIEASTAPDEEIGDEE